MKRHANESLCFESAGGSGDVTNLYHKLRPAMGEASPLPGVDFFVECGILSLLKQERSEKTMFLIVGLGNPTNEYRGTRHNVGFDVIDAIADKYNISVTERKNRAFCGKGLIEGQKVILAKPQTYMNLSGESVRGLVDFYKIDTETELLVIYDDVSLDVGQLRIRKKGSAGGHNRVKNIIQHLGSDVFKRIKVGVGEKPKEYDLVDYVLGHFSKEDNELMADGYKRAVEPVEKILQGDLDAAMNEFNKKVIKE